MTLQLNVNTMYLFAKMAMTHSLLPIIEQIQIWHEKAVQHEQRCFSRTYSINTIEILSLEKLLQLFNFILLFYVMISMYEMFSLSVHYQISDTDISKLQFYSNRRTDHESLISSQSKTALSCPDAHFSISFSPEIGDLDWKGSQVCHHYLG